MRRSYPLALALLSLVACQRATTAGGGTTQPPGGTDAAVVDPELAARIDKLEAALEAARVEHHVPGMGVAVVKDGKVVLARGFGLADLEGKVAATEDTVFSIGSSTKAFTSTMVGMLVDEGKMAWDDPIEKYVPELKLPIDDDDKGAKATLRDAMSHRTGFTRMSLLWIAGAVDTKEMFTRASTAEPWAKYQKQFLYNNVVYASAGEASARVAKMAWTDLLKTRVLDPLGMKGTTADQDAAQKNPARAQGYRWDEEAGEFVPLPMRPIPYAAPAGAIYSNAADMAKWVQFQLADGQVDGERLISHAALAETRSPQMQMAPTLGYGLGWMLAVHDGHRLVHHGGNIDGYAAMVAFAPEDDVGFVLLTNTTSTPLQNASLAIVFDAMLGSLDDGGGEKGKAEDLQPFTGTYVANFGPFKNTDFAVTAKDGKLYVDVPGQMNYELRGADDEGRRPFAITDTIEVSFERDDAGKVVVMRMHQAGFDFEIPRKGFVPPIEVPLADLMPLTGNYENPELGVAEVSISNNRLAVDIPKQMKVELHAPDAEGHRKIRIKSANWVEFLPAEGTPKTMVIHDGPNEATFTRKGGKSRKPLPTVDQIVALRHPGKATKPVEIVGTVKLPQSAVDGTMLWRIAPDGRFTTLADFGKFGRIDVVILAERGWTDVSFAPLQELRGKYLDQAQAELPLLLAPDWRTAFDSVTVDDQTEYEGRKAYVVTLKKGEAPPATLTVDAKTGDVLVVDQAVMEPGAGAIPTKTILSDYRKDGGLRLPHHIERSDLPSGKTIIDFQKVQPLTVDEATAFPSAPPKR